MRIKDILRHKKFKKTKTNKFWLMAEEAAKATDTKPARWLREIKNHEFAMKRALIDLKESEARKPIALFIFLIKKYKKQGI